MDVDESEGLVVALDYRVSDRNEVIFGRFEVGMDVTYTSSQGCKIGQDFGNLHHENDRLLSGRFPQVIGICYAIVKA